jgi:hypothetical protein
MSKQMFGSVAALAAHTSTSHDKLGCCCPDDSSIRVGGAAVVELDCCSTLNDVVSMCVCVALASDVVGQCSSQYTG